MEKFMLIFKDLQVKELYRVRTTKALGYVEYLELLTTRYQQMEILNIGNQPIKTTKQDQISAKRMHKTTDQLQQMQMTSREKGGGGRNVALSFLLSKKNMLELKKNIKQKNY